LRIILARKHKKESDTVGVSIANGLESVDFVINDAATEKEWCPAFKKARSREKENNDWVSSRLLIVNPSSPPASQALPASESTTVVSDVCHEGASRIGRRDLPFRQCYPAAPSPDGSGVVDGTVFRRV
jgi:hypothetical protein